jgi:hypothetical protein
LSVLVTTYKYRLRNQIGGLAADLDAEFRPPQEAPESYVQIHQRIRLELPRTGIYWKDLAWLAFGASLHAMELAERYPNGLSITIHSLRFPLADYRAEVAALAIEGWIRQELGLPEAGVYAEYSAADGTYSFHWGDEASPFDDS